MKILAIDASTKSTGWAVFEDKKLIDHGFITATSSNVLNRIGKMVEQLRIIFDRNNIQEIVIEDVIPEDVHHNQTVFKALIYLQAAIALEFNKNGKELHLMVSSEWRKLCGIHTGRGIKRDTLKSADIQFVFDNYKIKSNDDECDAICIGYAYTHQSKERESAF